MKNFSEIMFGRLSIPFLGPLLLLSFGLSCGKQTEKKPEAESTPTPAPTVAEQPETTPVAFWLTRDAGAGPVATRFDSAGRQSLQIDLVSSGVDYGPITALNFLDASTLLYFVNPGSGKEMFGSLDVKTALVKNRAWGSQSSIRDMFEDAVVSTMVSGFQSGVLHVQIETGIKTIRYNQDGGLSVQEFTLPAGCLTGKLSGIFMVQAGGRNQIIGLTHDSQTQLIVLATNAGNTTCGAFDYSNGETTSSHKPVNLVQMPDGKIYVLYQHAIDDRARQAPKIVRYDFDGASLTNAKTIFSSKDVLGPTPFGMIARTNKKLLVAQPLENALIEIAIKGDVGSLTDFYLNTAYVKDLKAMIAEPP